MQVWRRNWEPTCGHITIEMDTRYLCRVAVEDHWLYDLGDVWTGDINVGVVDMEIIFVFNVGSPRGRP